MMSFTPTHKTSLLPHAILGTSHQLQANEEEVWLCFLEKGVLKSCEHI